MEDNAIIELFFARDETALTEVENKYSRMYVGILNSVLNDTEDVQECRNDLLISLWRIIPPERPRCLAAFISKLARRIGIDRYRRNTRRKRGGGQIISLTECEENGITAAIEPFTENDSAEIGRSISDFLRTLDEETRILFIRRYFFNEAVNELAKRFELSENVISVRLHRAKERLKKYLEKEGIYL